MLEQDAMVNVIKTVLRSINVVPRQRRVECLAQILSSLVGMSADNVNYLTALALKLIIGKPKYSGVINRNVFIPNELMLMSTLTPQLAQLFISQVESHFGSSLASLYGDKISDDWLYTIGLPQQQTGRRHKNTFIPPPSRQMMLEFPTVSDPPHDVRFHPEMECCHPTFRKIMTTAPLPDNLQFSTKCNCIQCFLRNCYPCKQITHWLGAQFLNQNNVSSISFMLSSEEMEKIQSDVMVCNMYVLTRVENQWKLDDRRFRISINGIDIFGNMSIMYKNQYNLRRLLRVGRNTVIAHYFPPMTYVAFHISTEQTIKQYVDQFKKEATHSLEQSKADFLRLLEDEEDLGIDSSFPFSLLDPLSKLRMTVPVRPTTCDHLPCFDLPNFLEIYLNKEKKLCPVCNQPILMSLLKLDRYVLQMLESTDEEQDEVNVKPSGEWELCEQKEEKSEEEESEPEPEPEPEPIKKLPTNNQYLSGIPFFFRMSDYDFLRIPDLWDRQTLQNEIESLSNDNRRPTSNSRVTSQNTNTNNNDSDGIIDLVSDSDSSQEPQLFSLHNTSNVEIIDILDFSVYSKCIYTI